MTKTPMPAARGSARSPGRPAGRSPLAGRSGSLALLALLLTLPAAVLAPSSAAAQEAAALAPAAPKPPAISVVTAARRELVARLVVTGTLVPRETVVVGAEVDGLRIEALLADEGDRVEAGDVLARLSTDVIEIELARNDSQVARSDAAIAQAESQIAEAEATEIEASAALERTLALKEGGIVGQDVLDQRVSVASAAKARLSSARQGLAVARADKALTLAERRELELRRNKTEIRAPAGGLILSRAARVGATASSSGDPLFELARDGLIELDAEVSETVLNGLAPKQPVSVLLPGTAEALTGSVRLISPQVDEATRLGQVRIALPPSDALRSGSFARGLVDTARSSGVVVPLTAVVTEGGRSLVQVVRDGRIETRDVTLGISMGSEVEVLAGLAEGEAVVALAGTFVRDGDTVTPVAIAAVEAEG